MQQQPGRTSHLYSGRRLLIPHVGDKLGSYRVFMSSGLKTAVGKDHLLFICRFILLQQKIDRLLKSPQLIHFQHLFINNVFRHGGILKIGKAFWSMVTANRSESSKPFSEAILNHSVPGRGRAASPLLLWPLLLLINSTESFTSWTDSPG